MVLLDSNIFIFALKPKYQDLRQWCLEQDIHASDITRLEVLGYHLLSDDDKQDLALLFELTTTLEISSSVIDQAIELRRKKKIKLGDAIIAATAMEHKLTLVTHNTKDFTWLDGLKLIDPLSDIKHA